ncbi:MAG: hypothetical protein FJ291_22310 [Planctomycetes bacterium]|nr:hypothetical protein [Planctomycetota bacterium]
MAAVFPLLYVLENSMRQLIDRVMRAKHGGNWWPKCAPQGLQAAVAKRMADDERDSWHQRRGAREIDYLDLNQLPALVRNNQKDFFPTILSTIEWFDQFVKEIYTSRCVVCHMNPLDSNNIRAVEVRRKQWEKQLSAKLHLL